MIQIFFFGSSSIYGVGGERGGYADIVKQTFHGKMFGENGVGEKYELFNFGKSGATIDFVLNVAPKLFEYYKRNGKTITVLNVGGNNAKAEGEPENFVSTLEEYSEQMARLLDLLKEKSEHVIAVGSGFYDEAKTSPKISPLNGGKSYFSNKRSREFQEEFKKLCDERNIPFITVGVSEDEWKKTYIYKDGLHANRNGHELIAEKIMIEIEKILE